MTRGVGDRVRLPRGLRLLRSDGFGNGVRLYSLHGIVSVLGVDPSAPPGMTGLGAFLDSGLRGNDGVGCRDFHCGGADNSG